MVYSVIVFNLIKTMMCDHATQRLTIPKVCNPTLLYYPEFLPQGLCTAKIKNISQNIQISMVKKLCWSDLSHS